MPTDTERLARATAQAHAQLVGIQQMIERLTHATACAGPCDAADADGPDTTAYHDVEAAEDAIREDPLSVEIRSGWYAPFGGPGEPEEYRIVLCTGGPAVQIIGDLPLDAEAVRLQYQDWFTEWMDYPVTAEEAEALTEYAGHFLEG